MSKQLIRMIKSTDNNLNNHDLIVFSHLRWEFVTQRPQHVIGRIAVGRKVLFVEEPIPFEEKEEGTAKILKVNKNIKVLQPKISWDNWTQSLSDIIKKYQKSMKLKSPMIWFYSPQFIDLVNSIDHSLIVFDCMDELSAFKGAAPTLIENERKLLQIADVVFTGGKSLYESKKRFAENVHCFPSSVDRLHFEKALKKQTRIPSDMKSIKKPIVGYYGVIDERIDMPLLAKIAQLNPQVNFVMIGPVVKISDQDLAKRENIHYLGGKPYEKLPNYLKAFDIAMMPFALNESTKFISPTKTLEYMAAKKPIISTPIYDVVRGYKNEVSIIHNAQEFSKAINYFLNENETEKVLRVKLQKAVIDRTSWDNTATSMARLMGNALKQEKLFTKKIFTARPSQLAYE